MTMYIKIALTTNEHIGENDRFATIFYLIQLQETVQGRPQQHYCWQGVTASLTSVTSVHFASEGSSWPVHVVDPVEQYSSAIAGTSLHIHVTSSQARGPMKKTHTPLATITCDLFIITYSWLEKNV